MSRFRSDRPAFTILELMIALGLMAVFCAVFVPLLASVSRERRLTMQEHAAMQHAANVLEIMTQRPFAELSGSTDATLPPIPADVQRLLPDAEQTVTVAPAADDVAALKITVELQWRQSGGRSSRPVALSAWVHAREGASP
jgi:type II secretory pathway pseudopilin PulG